MGSEEGSATKRAGWSTRPELITRKEGEGEGRGTRGGKRARDNKNKIGVFRELENVERPLDMLQEKCNTTIKTRASY